MAFKFLHLQSHFIHLYFLTVFEVLFYIYYVMPYEKSIFKHMFDKDIPQFDDAIFANITYPFSAENCDKYQTELDNANVHLWKCCFIYIEIVTSVLFAFFLRDLYKIYQGYKILAPSQSPRHNSHSSLVSFGSFPNLSEYKKTDDSIEITNLSSPKDDNKMVPIENETIYKYYWYNSGFLAEFIKTAEFIILVGIFEYFFFVSIVDKYKIANSKTILCDLLKKAS
jgi:hypothetical protein